MSSRRRIAFVFTISLTSVAPLAPGADVTSTWLAGQTGSWTESDLWSTPLFPNNGGGTTYVARINSSTASVTLNTPITVNGFNLFAGTLAGGNTLNVVNAMDWSAGTLAGSGTINIQNELFMFGGPRGFSGFNVNIASGATATWQDGNIMATATEGGVFNNNGTFDDQTDDAWMWINLQTPVFNNNGTFVKTDGTDGFTKGFWAAFNNTGFVDVQTSGIWFTGGGANTGSFSVADGAMLSFSDYNADFASAGAPTTTFSSTASISSLGTVTFDNDFGAATTSFGGTYSSAFTVVDPGAAGLVHFTSTSTIDSETPGDVEILSGTLQLDTSAGSVAFGGVSLAGGTLKTSDDLFLNSLTWSSGTISGDSPLRDISTGSLVLSGTGAKVLLNTKLYNGVDSVAVMSSGSLDIRNATFINLAGGTFDFQGNATITNTDVENVDAVFVNAGYLIKSAGSGSTQFIGVQVQNNGTVLVQSGTLRFAAGGDHLGAFSISNGATLEFAGDPIFNNFTLRSSSSLSTGATGTLRVTGGGGVFAEDGATFNVAGTTRVDQGATLQLGGNGSAGNVVLQTGGKLQLLGTNRTLNIKSLSIDVANDSRLDVGMNRAVLSYSGSPPINDVRSLIISGYHGGDWLGGGISSLAAQFDTSKAVGYFDNATADELIIAYTWYGDATLDGLVDVADLYAMASHWQQSNQDWFTGDFNYDGLVNQVDLGLLALNWSNTGELPFPEVLNNLGLSNAVPEPSMLTLGMSLMAGALLRRQRRTTSTPHSGHLPDEARRS